MGEELNDAGNGIGAIDGAFGAADDFYFIDVVEREARKINGAAWRIDGHAVHEDFGEVGVSAVEKNGSGSPFGSRAADGDAC